jgi:hypothetical protein
MTRKNRGRQGWSKHPTRQPGINRFKSPSPYLSLNQNWCGLLDPNELSSNCGGTVPVPFTASKTSRRNRKKISLFLFRRLRKRTKMFLTYDTILNWETMVKVNMTW